MDTPREQAVTRFFTSGLKLNQLRILVALAELKQITLVAEAFHVTQPAISKQIADMEAALGVPLLKRVGQRVEYTPYGEALTVRAREILHQLNQARKDLDLLMTGAAGRIALGMVTTVTPVLIPEAVAAFHRRAPNVSVAITEGTADRLLPMLEERALDLVVTRTPVQEDAGRLLQAPIGDDPMVLVVSSQHPLAYRMSPTWHDLDGLQWVLPSPRSPAYQALTALLKVYGISYPSGCIESTSLIANAGLIARTSMIGLLPKTLAIQHVAEGTLAIVPLDLSSVLERVYVVSHPDNDNPTVEVMKECLRYVGRVHAGTGVRS